MPNDNFNTYCENLLVEYNRRNTQAITRYLDSLCGFLRQDGSHVVQTMFGGSVRRGTDVTGLSDVDVLLIVNQSSLVNRPPSEVIAYVCDTIQHWLPHNPVSAGNLAVTVGYSDRTEIQILPAIRTNSDGVRIAEPGSSRWSNVVIPDNFAENLREVNRARNGRVVSVIKLAKAIVDCLITRRTWKITGYHMEALAIDAFRNYQGQTDSRSMLNHLFTHSIRAVMRPIEDSTGQSRYVDEYLGSADSKARRRAATYFGQMRANVRSCTTKADFNNLFCIGN